MKFVTYSPAGTTARLGITVEGGIIDLSAHLAACPPTMTDLIAAWDELAPAIRKIVAQTAPDHPLDEAQLLPPIQRPGKILGIGLNYADHVKESGMEAPTEPLWFAKMPTTVNAPHGDVDVPRVSEQLDYEVELAVIIGRRCKHVPTENAADVIFGFCVANDFSVRDWQLRTSQFMVGKSFDTHAPFGPWITTADEMTTPHGLDIECRVNGEVRQKSNTSHLVYNCYAQIAHLSQAMTLEPGDIILTGTPGGVGAAFQPPRWLRNGDLVESSISGLGTLRNRIRNES